jgi:uncharacterized membrane protein
MKPILIILTVFALSSFFFSCKYDKEETPKPSPSETTQDSITYTNHTKRIIDQYCTACHAPSASQAFFPLTTFNEVSVYSGSNGLLQVRVLNQENMPPTGSSTGQLTAAEKDTLQMWINQGALQ